MREKNTSDLLDECLKIYDMNIPEFAVEIEIPKTTVQGWADGKNSAVAMALLKKVIQCKKEEEKNSVIDAFFALSGEMYNKKQPLARKSL